MSGVYQPNSIPDSKSLVVQVQRPFGRLVCDHSDLCSRVFGVEGYHTVDPNFGTLADTKNPVFGSV